jgi:hypothetical protein
MDIGVVLSGIERDFCAEILSTFALSGDCISSHVPSLVFPEPLAPTNSKFLVVETVSLLPPWRGNVIERCFGTVDIGCEMMCELVA